MVNVSGMYNIPTKYTMEEIGTIIYPVDVTPWVAPDTGDFRISLSQAKNAGRGFWLQTGAYSGTVGYPDIGAAQHIDNTSSSSGPALVGQGIIILK